MPESPTLGTAGNLKALLTVLYNWIPVIHCVVNLKPRNHYKLYIYYILSNAWI